MILDDDDEFFENNTHKVNKLVSKIFAGINFVPPLLILLSYYHVFQIQTSFMLKVECGVIPFTIVNIVLVYCFASSGFRLLHREAYERIQHTAKYFGLLGTAFVLGVLGTHAHIGIYISYALVVFISCLYYNTRTTVITGIFSYIVMLGSQYLKSVNRSLEGMTFNTVFFDWMAFSLGFTIEFIFTFLISILVTRKSGRTLSSAIENNEKLKKTQLDFMAFIPNMLKKHEIITGCHVEHTVEYVKMLCNELRAKQLYTKELTPENIAMFSAAANLHDVGKIHIPDHILNKPGKFTPEEFEMMKRHPKVGYEIIDSMPEIFNGKFNEIAKQMALCHHERWDGTGYPNGMKGEEIPLCARIMAVADVTDALLSFRPYKEPFTIEKTMKIIEEGKGTQFEPAIADAMINLAPIVMMYASERATIEKPIITMETEWREKERESLSKGITITEEEEKHMQ